MVSFKIAGDIPLVKRKDVIDTSYIFDFGDYGFSGGCGTGKAKAFSGERIELKTDLSSMIVNHIDNALVLSLFGGNAENEQWRRRYKTVDVESTNI